MVHLADDATRLPDFISDDALDRHALSHDASHFLLVPSAVAVPSSVADMVELFGVATALRRPLTFRSGGTSLSGQGVTDQILVDVRRQFRGVEVLDGGARVRVEPGVTLRQVNARLAAHGRMLGPDPASEVACTIGGVVANNSSGMSCGIELNAYRTVESLLLVLPSGTVVDTGAADADALLLAREPRLHAGLIALRDRIRTEPSSVDNIRRRFSMKNTMGYSLNAFLDFSTPAELLTRLVIGSEGTLAFVAAAVFRTVPVRPRAATALAVYPDLSSATAALPDLASAGLASIELLDTRSLAVASKASPIPSALRDLVLDRHVALLVEHRSDSEEGLEQQVSRSRTLLARGPSRPVGFTSVAGERDALWQIRKGLYASVAGARPAGTTALLEDIVVPVPRLSATCSGLSTLLAEHGYQDFVVFGHAKDGNLHFMLCDRLGEAGARRRYAAFTEDLVDLVLAQDGNLKAEHGTGRMMAPYVRRQYGDELTEVMWELKRLCDPAGLLNPGVVLAEDPTVHLRDLKAPEPVEHEVDRCVECGYCEPTCPSRDLTTTPRQRIALRRDIAAARRTGDVALQADLESAYGYAAVDTCAADGMCRLPCPVGIDTGDLVRRLRGEASGRTGETLWRTAARHWGSTTTLLSGALTLARAVPAAVPRSASRLGRAIAGQENVPLYDGGLPGGGRRSHAPSHPSPEAVLFPSCLNTIFGAAGGGSASADAVRRLCDRAGTPVTGLDHHAGFCCGTPWKSKGRTSGLAEMAARVVPTIIEATRAGELPVVCDSSSCSDGLASLLADSISQHPGAANVQVMDAVDFVADHLLPRLRVERRTATLVLHPTCSSAKRGGIDAMRRIAGLLADDVVIPAAWGCCGFAGDRGLLRPELTAAATRHEAEEVAGLDPHADHASANRTCELAMTRATGRTYHHLLDLLERSSQAEAGP
ncbi:FAD-binding and (Fe-S)-binding domain-containing protein [Pseudonocardia sp. RS010]|uniref:FAD-binding and (Fe-S)-binding domain-containing protein n=1 Tax=Pseudonocardia sp. RS010 TaxID=3385979 RepID=UPI00399FB969